MTNHFNNLFVKKNINLESKKEFIYLDIFRCLFATGVIIIHTEPFKNFNPLLNFIIVEVICRICVPFFFLVTGYFLHQKTCLDKSWGGTFKLILKKMIIMYILWTIVYLYPIYKDILFSKIGIKPFFIFFKNFLLIGSYIHLWYFVAVIFGVIILFILINVFKIKNKHLFILAFIFYIIGVLGNSYGFDKIPIFKIYFIVFNTTRNGVFFGFPMLTFGYLISFYKNKIFNQKYIVYFLVSFAMMFAESIFIKNVFNNSKFDMTFMLLPTSIFLFLYILFKQYDKGFINNIKLRHLSAVIFGIHNIIYYVLLLLNTHFLQFRFLCFIIVVIFSFLLSNLILEMSKNKHLEFFKYFY